MTRVAVTPCVSPRGLREELRSLVDSYTSSIRGLADADCILVDDGETLPEHDILILLVMGGGSEASMMSCLQRSGAPVLAVARPAGNALPAALDVVSIARDSGRKAILIQATEGWEAEVREALTVLAAGVKMGGSRLGVIGVRDVEVASALELKARVERVWGPQLVYIPMRELIKAVNAVADDESLKSAAVEAGRELYTGATCVAEPDEATMVGAAEIYYGLRQVVEAYRLDAVTVKCFDLLPVLRNSGCYALARLNDEGIPAGCEADVLSTLGMLLLRLLTRRPSFMANPVSLDVATGTLIAAHCTIARTMIESYILRSHLESGIGVGIQGFMDAGPVTVLRLGGRNLDRLFVSDAAVIGCGSVGGMCRTQLRIQIPESDDPGAIIGSPLGNHHLVVRDHWKSSIDRYMSLFVR